MQINETSDGPCICKNVTHIESKVAMLNFQIPGAVRVRQTRRPGRESRLVYGIWSCLY